MDKNLPNKLTKFRIFLTMVVIFILLFPFNMINVNIPKYLIGGVIILDIKLVIAAVLFIIASITDFFDGYIARKYNLVTNKGKVLDAIADKILVNSILIILCGQGYVYSIIPVILVMRDIIVDTIKMIAGTKGDVVAAIKTGKFKTAFLMIGVSLKLLGNFPMGLYNIALDDFFLLTATVLSCISGYEYYKIYRKYLKD